MEVEDTIDIEVDNIIADDALNLANEEEGTDSLLQEFCPEIYPTFPLAELAME